MRLLDTETLRFESFDDPQSAPDYAILSHVWSSSGEQSYREVVDVMKHARDGDDYEQASGRLSEKIMGCCAQALAEGYKYIWIDSCCIDKTSSAELSEAINSRCKWYRSASQCYAYFHDVDDDDDPRAPNSQFRTSEWFTRGWTLQELIAPPVLVFLTKDWIPIGTKHSMAQVVSEITGVDAGVLQGAYTIEKVSVARRMSWASKRVTTREEDEAYSLMGLFGIHMPTIYGEGRHAFIRLQEEILKQFPDDTLFAWGNRCVLSHPRDLLSTSSFISPLPPHHNGRLFASSPRRFRLAGDLRPVSQATLMRRLGMQGPSNHGPLTYSLTRYGVHAELPILRSPVAMLGFLLCLDVSGRLVALILQPPADLGHLPSPGRRNDTLLVGAPAADQAYSTVPSSYRLVVLTVSLLREMARTWELEFAVTHIPQQGQLRPSSRDAVNRPYPHQGRYNVLIHSWCKVALMHRGYNIHQWVIDEPKEDSSPASRSSSRHVFVLLHPAGLLSIMIGHCGYCDPQYMGPGTASGLRMQVRSCYGPVGRILPPYPEIDSPSTPRLRQNIAWTMSSTGRVPRTGKCIWSTSWVDPTEHYRLCGSGSCSLRLLEISCSHSRWT